MNLDSVQLFIVIILAERRIVVICLKHQLWIKNRSAYTAIEIIIALGIIGMTIISVSPIAKWLRQQGVRHAVIQLQADLQLARVMAIRQRQSCSLLFNHPHINQYVNLLLGRVSDLGGYRGGIHFLDKGPDGMKMASEVKFNEQGMSSTIVPADIFLTDNQRMATYRIRIMLPGGISVYNWDGKRWQ